MKDSGRKLSLVAAMGILADAGRAATDALESWDPRIMLDAGNKSTTRGFNTLSQKGRRRRARQRASQSFRAGKR